MEVTTRCSQQMASWSDVAWEGPSGQAQLMTRGLHWPARGRPDVLRLFWGWQSGGGRGSAMGHGRLQSWGWASYRGDENEVPGHGQDGEGLLGLSQLLCVAGSTLRWPWQCCPGVMDPPGPSHLQKTSPWRSGKEAGSSLRMVAAGPGLVSGPFQPSSTSGCDEWRWYRWTPHSRGTGPGGPSWAGALLTAVPAPSAPVLTMPSLCPLSHSSGCSWQL